MPNLSQIARPEQYPTETAPGLPSFDAQLLVHHHSDAHWIVTNAARQLTGRVSLWWTQVPPHPVHRLGLLGHFAASDEPSAKSLLARAVDELAARGCTLAIGPIDGNTWRRYRLLTRRGSEPPFLFEPDNPDEWVNWFQGSGFYPLARYFSALADNLALEDPRIPKAIERLNQNGIQWRALNPAKFDDELGRIYEVAAIAFQKNFLYTPIPEQEFLLQYQAIRDYIRPELVLIAEQGARPVGFVFAIPDLLQAKRGALDTVVVKTVAVLPARAYAGLGNVLVARCHEAARQFGFRRAIHALMHESNNSLNLSAHYARPFRYYALFAHELAAHP